MDSVEWFWSNVSLKERAIECLSRASLWIAGKQWQISAPVGVKCKEASLGWDNRAWKRTWPYTHYFDIMCACAHSPLFHVNRLMGLNLVSSHFLGNYFKFCIVEQHTVADQQDESSEVALGFWEIMKNISLNQSNTIINHSKLNILVTIFFLNQRLMQWKSGLSKIKHGTNAVFNIMPCLKVSKSGPHGSRGQEELFRQKPSDCSRNLFAAYLFCVYHHDYCSIDMRWIIPWEKTSS